ncbi:CLUMA_CG007257, isoform A [Clunio marinus]|uniref:CLUMA_CG007257, isoform A n=1 Tax=Clunio marinus TaxID=568069 RepID=A0A1J1I5S0_9DIPT|nr:CLUMA_CG007257, isoform A [Clunio marinus]
MAITSSHTYNPDLFINKNRTIRSDRSDFKREPCKVSSLDGWTVEIIENSSQTNTFQLMNSSIGNPNLGCFKSLLKIESSCVVIKLSVN